MPGVKREWYIPPVVRNDRLYLIGRDELGVQRVLVFRVQRDATEAMRPAVSSKVRSGRSPR